MKWPWTVRRCIEVGGKFWHWLWYVLTGTYRQCPAAWKCTHKGGWYLGCKLGIKIIDSTIMQAYPNSDMHLIRSVLCTDLLVTWHIFVVGGEALLT